MAGTLALQRGHCRDSPTACNSRKISGLYTAESDSLYLNILVEIGVLDHDVAGYDGEGELYLEVGLSRGERDLLGEVPHGGLVLQLHHGLHGPVVVVNIDGPHHLLPLQVPNSKQDLRDAVASAKLHHLGAGGELGVHLQTAQLEVGEADLGIVADKARIRL